MQSADRKTQPPTAFGLRVIERDLGNSYVAKFSRLSFLAIGTEIYTALDGGTISLPILG
jgi:hypothetical protein